MFLSVAGVNKDQVTLSATNKIVNDCYIRVNERSFRVSQPSKTKFYPLYQCEDKL